MAQKHIQLFDLIKMMFKDPTGYSKLGSYDKERNSFMINRIFSTNFPLQAHMLSKNGIKGEYLVDFWFNIAKRNYIGARTRIPNWVYTKTKNVQTKVKPFKYSIKDPEVIWLLNKKEWSLKDWDINLLLNRDNLKKELDFISKQITIQVKEIN